MITESMFRTLLDRPESETLDFKREPHRLDNDHFKSEFVKDILAMANTPRDEAAYIIIGVKVHKDGSKTLVGVTEHPDDADLQKKLNLAQVEPKPTFLYQSIIVDGLSYGVIEIPVKKSGPYLPMKSYGVLTAYRLCFRRGTENVEASPHEQDHIYQWFHGTEPRERDLPPDAPVPHWHEFALACHHFDASRLYLFILGPNQLQSEAAWLFLSRLPLSVVLDFDPATAERGAYSYVEPDLKQRRSLHLLTLGDEYTTLIPEKACYWYAARGLHGRMQSLVDADYRQWNRKYVPALQNLLGELARSSGGRLLTVVCLWQAPEYVREICTTIDRAFGDEADYVFATSEVQVFEGLANQFHGNTFPMSLGSVLSGIPQYVKTPASETAYEVGIPKLDTTLTFLSRQDLLWLEEDMEVLHSSIEMTALPEQLRQEDSFLRGSTISWSNLRAHQDADRDVTVTVVEQVRRDLKFRSTVRVRLQHWPGAGGTTVARRVAWELKREYPTVLLKRITPGETIGRFRTLFSATEQSILAVIEGADVTPEQLEKLYIEVGAENIPVVFLVVSRRFEIPSTTSQRERVFFLGQHLSRDEGLRFADIYKDAAPVKAGALEQLTRGASRDRTVFLFALTAFGRDFAGIARYVQSRLEVSTQAQREILTFLSLAYYYGHKPLYTQLFATYLNQSRHHLLRLEKILQEPQLELVIEEGDHHWRPIHHLIAEEILQRVLAGNNDQRLWYTGLSTIAIEFIRLCRDGSFGPNEDVIEILYHVFIQRDEQEQLGTEQSEVGSPKFAHLIEDVRNPDGQQSVFEELVASFPSEAHFWGHLGRFYSIQKYWEKALRALDRAIELDPTDGVLHHMRGMCIYREAFEMMRKLRLSQPEGSEEELKRLVERAKEAFSTALFYDSTSEYAYTSQIQLLLRALDFGFATSGFRLRSDFLTSSRALWYLDQLDEAEQLMERVRSIREGDKPSPYILKYQDELDSIYGDQSRALERWNNLLAQTGVFAPPVRRQIVQAYLTRKNRQWSSLSSSEIERVVTLMEENIQEEPTSDSNIRYWFRAIRYSSRQSMTITLDRVTNWKVIGDSLEANYYLYILYVLQALDGDSTRLNKTEDLINQSTAKSRNQRTRTRSFEWLGDGVGLRRLKHYTELGEWDEASNFYQNTTGLTRVEGLVRHVNSPAAGIIEVASTGLPAFFVPSKVGKKGIEKGKHSNARVRFYLGFSYSGLRAWSVELAE